MRTAKVLILLLLPLLLACQSDEERALREKLATPSSTATTAPKSVSKTTIREYREAELAINRRYLAEVKDIIENDFDKKVEEFEDKEFGFFRSYKHMFKVLLNNKQEMDDYWNLKKSKYFANHTTREKLHEAYVAYTNDITALRSQISKRPNRKPIPKEVQYNLAEQDISLSGMNEYAYKSLAIEFGMDIAEWLLGMLIVAILTLVIGVAAPPTWIITVIALVASVCLTVHNDNKMVESLKEQYTVSADNNYDSILQTLDQSTISFYDYIK